MWPTSEPWMLPHPRTESGEGDDPNESAANKWTGNVSKQAHGWVFLGEPPLRLASELGPARTPPPRPDLQQ